MTLNRRRFLLLTPVLAAGGCVTVGGASGPPMPAPSWKVGDRWVYRCSDGFRVPVQWEEAHEVTALDASGIVLRITAQGDVNFERNERLASPGVVNSGAAYDPAETRNFEPPMVRFQFPLTPNTDWRQNLRNLDPANQLMSNIGRFVRVGGYETVAVPAGTFNAITMRTLMSVDDNNPFRWPIQANYMTWWAQEAGNVVRMTKVATYRERGDGMDAIEIRAQNTTIELASFRRA
ncbi:MAG: hypothetical protein IT516_15550 [Burkholderiales bacterium]|nr:hypothetical protein [Burkholderiales bacterium]